MLFELRNEVVYHDMKYLSQFCIIMGFTFVGEALHRFLPLPIPASVYSLVLLFLALCTGIVKLEQVKEVGSFLTSILPILFVAPAVGIVKYWDLISGNLPPILVLILITTVVTFGISGYLVQRLSDKEESEDE